MPNFKISYFWPHVQQHRAPDKQYLGGNYPIEINKNPINKKILSVALTATTTKTESFSSITGIHCMNNILSPTIINLIKNIY